MSVYARVFGRELPCSVLELLRIPHLSLSAKQLDQLHDQALLGRGDPSSSYRLGLAHLSCGQAGLACRWFASAVEEDTSSPAAARLALAAALEMAGQHQPAATQIDAVADDPALTEQVQPAISPALLLCAAGFALERAGQWQSASLRYQSALLHAPNEVFAHHRLVAIKLAQGLISDAALHLKVILGQQPGEQAYRICLGHLLQSDGRFAEAAWEYEQALCLEPDGWELPGNISRQLQEMQSTDQAIALLELLITTQPHFPDLRMRLGNLYSLRGDDALACQEYHTALSLHPDYLECHIALARHQMRLGRSEQAAEHFQDAVAINNQQVEIYVGLAMARYRGKQQSQATEHLRSAAKIAHNSAVLLAQIGMLQGSASSIDVSSLTGTELSTQWLEELVVNHQNLLVEHPGWNDIRVEMGMLQRLLGHLDEAYRTLRQAALADPNCSQAWLHLGLTLNDRGQTEDAASALANALQLDPHWASLQYRLGLAYCGDLEFDLALERLQENSPQPLDAQRQVFLALDQLHMSRSEEVFQDSRRTLAVARQGT